MRLGVEALIQLLHGALAFGELTLAFASLSSLVSAGISSGAVREAALRRSRSASQRVQVRERGYGLFLIILVFFQVFSSCRRHLPKSYDRTCPCGRS